MERLSKLTTYRTFGSSPEGHPTVAFPHVDAAKVLAMSALPAPRGDER